MFQHVASDIERAQISKPTLGNGLETSDVVARQLQVSQLFTVQIRKLLNTFNVVRRDVKTLELFEGNM
jgi:hypothetical protein